MSTTVRITPLTLHRDHRGWVFELLEPDEFSWQRNAHLVLSEPGQVRGNHYHVKGTERVAVLGPALVRYREGETIRDVEIPEGAAWRFDFPPGVAHAIRNTGKAAQLTLAFNTEPHDREHPDVVREVLIEP